MEPQKNQLITALSNKRQSVFIPPPTVTLSQWAEDFLYLSPEASALPGRFRFHRAPFQREMFDALSNPAYKKVVIQAASQLVKTQAILSYIGYIVHLDPGPVLVVQPTREMADSFSKDRLATMLRDTPVLQGKVNDAALKNSGNTVGHKTFPGGHITMVGSNSPAGLASRPIRFLFCDEIDRYELTTKEGDPINIARARTTTYWNAKEVLVSSPGDEDISRIAAEYEQTDQREYYVKCHKCEHEQTLSWSQVKWDDGNPDNAHYVCGNCNTSWSEGERLANVRHGRWIAKYPDRATVGFKISALYSSFKTLADLANEFINVKNEPDQLKVFVNTRLAETWKRQASGVDEIDFLSRLEQWDSTLIPDGVLAITAGVDTQTDRIEVEVIGWGEADENWSLEYIVIHGNPQTNEPWNDLIEYLNKKYKRRDGMELQVLAMCIDSGYATQSVYQFAHKYSSRKVYAIKGGNGPRPIFPKKYSQGKGGGRVYIVGVDTAKERIYELLNIKHPGPGFCHFPKDRDNPDYYKQLTSEKFVTKIVNGKKTRKWFLKPGLRNEALDCRVYAMAARYSLNAELKMIEKQRQNRAAKKAKQQNQQPDPDDSVQPVPPPPTKKKRPVRSNWMRV